MLELSALPMLPMLGGLASFFFGTLAFVAVARFAEDVGAVRR